MEDKERISAYLDDGLSSEELDAIGSIESESEFGIASRYQMMGEAMRGQVSDATMIDISAQVREAIQNEAIQTVEKPARQAVQQPRQPMFDFSAWFRPLGGLAVAASVALVMVIAVTQVDSPTGSGNMVAGTDNSIVNTQDAVRPVAVAIEDTRPANQKAVNLDAYLAEHAEFAAQDTLQGRMPYARAVSYESE
jgi:negative regulator of sigma E activity